MGHRSINIVLRKSFDLIWFQTPVVQFLIGDSRKTGHMARNNPSNLSDGWLRLACQSLAALLVLCTLSADKLISMETMSRQQPMCAITYDSVLSCVGMRTELTRCIMKPNSIKQRAVTLMSIARFYNRSPSSYSTRLLTLPWIVYVGTSRGSSYSVNIVFLSMQRPFKERWTVSPHEGIMQNICVRSCNFSFVWSIM